MTTMSDSLTKNVEPGPNDSCVFYARRTAEDRMYNPIFDGDWPLDDAHYVHAANVSHSRPLTDDEALEHCWVATNTVNEVWWARDDVDRLIDFPDARSMCVGDVVLLPNGGAYRCAPAGWTKL